MADSRQYMALEWVIKDIKDTLAQAQRALNAYERDQNDVIRQILPHLHPQVYGSCIWPAFIVVR